MITFKKFLIEGHALEGVEKEVDDFIKAGEIVKPEFEALKGDIDRRIRKEGELIGKEYSYGRGNELYDMSHDLGDLHYVIPQSLNEVGSLKNKLAKVKDPIAKNHAFFKALSEFQKTYGPLVDKMKTLKGMIITTAQKRAVVKQAKEVEKKARFGDMKPLTKVLTKHIDDFVKRASDMAADYFDSAMAAFKKSGLDLDVFAPSPNSRMSRVEYRMAGVKRAFYQMHTDGKGKDRKLSVAKRKEYIEQAEKHARDDYMAWVAKMTEKIGKPVTKAKMTGSPWTGSKLEVETAAGESQTWTTKMIINQSKYEKLFNQFPSRKLK